MKDFEVIRNKASKQCRKNPQYIEFGKRLKTVLKDHHVTQKRLCQITGLSITMVGKWVGGLAIMKVHTFATIVDALGLTAMEIAYLLEAFWEDDDG